MTPHTIRTVPEPRFAAIADSTAMLRSRLTRSISIWDVIASSFLMISSISMVWLLTTQDPFKSHKSERWFDADLMRVYKSMSERWTIEHHRCSVHPLFALIMVPTHYGLTRTLGVSDETAIRIAMAGGAALWVGLLYLTLRLSRRTVFDSFLFASIGLVSSAALFFLTAPETYVFGSSTMLGCLCMVAAYERGLVSAHWVWLAAASTLTITTTNFMAGGFALLVLFGWKAGLQKAVNIFFAIAVLSVVQSLIFPDAASFLAINTEQQFVGREEAGSLYTKGRALIVHSVVAPKPSLYVNRSQIHCLSFQQSSVGSSGSVGIAATLAWGALLLAGLWGTVRGGSQPLYSRVLLLTVAGQLFLHTFYGFETFLYSLHVAPLLILLAAGSTGLKATIVFRTVGLGLLLLLLVNNGMLFDSARTIFAGL